MKTSLVILSLFVASVGISSAATVFTTTSPGGVAGGYRGLTVTLGHSWYTQSSDPAGKDIKNESSVQLDSLTLTSQSNNGFYAGTVFMLVFEAGSDFNSTVGGTLLGASGAVTWRNDAVVDITFAFSSGVMLKPDTKYSFVFSSRADSYADLPGIGNNAQSLRIAMGAGSTGDQGAYKNEKGWVGGAAAKMTIKTSSVEVVPEPSTAALGILGLASLMLRRRRK